MDNIVRLDALARERLESSIALANEKRLGFRICTGTDENGTWVKWDAGSGWTPPYYGVTL